MEQNRRIFSFLICEGKNQWNNNLYNYYCKHKEEPFEINREIKTIIWGAMDFARFIVL